MPSSLITSAGILKRALKPSTAPLNAANGPKPSLSKVVDRYPTQIALQNRRTTGVTRKLVGGYQQSPARMVPKSPFGVLKRMMGGKR